MGSYNSEGQDAKYQDNLQRVTDALSDGVFTTPTFNPENNNYFPNSTNTYFGLDSNGGSTTSAANLTSGFNSYLAFSNSQATPQYFKLQHPGV